MAAGIALFSAGPALASDPEIPQHYASVTANDLTELVILKDGLYPAYAQPDTSRRLEVFYAQISVSNTITYPGGERSIDPQAASQPFTAGGVEWRAVRAKNSDSEYAFILNSVVAEVVPSAGNPHAYLLGKPSPASSSAPVAPAASSAPTASTQEHVATAEPTPAGQDQTRPFPPVLWAAVAVLALAVIVGVTIQLKKKGKH